MDTTGIAKGMALVLELTSAAAALAQKAQAIGALIQKAQKEGRDLNDSEMQSLRDADDLAKAKLELAIQSAGS